MSNKYEQRFFSALKDTFVGHKIKGKSGYVNLLDLKQQYFAQIEPYIKKEIDETIEESSQEELYEKLYSFFDSYLNETGSVFFANSQLHKNLYERVYSDREDVSLFWKTQKLYYVKSEAMYDDLETVISDITYVFDASDIKHAKGNEKKSLVFYLVDVQPKKLTFKVRYQEQAKYDRLKEYLEIEKPNDIKDHLIENYDDSIHGNVTTIQNNIDRSVFSKKGDLRDCIYCNNENDALNSVTVEFSPSKIEQIHFYCNSQSVICTEEEIKKAFHIYKKQNEVDYFIHKDAESFLKEQFDIYTYNWLFNDLNTEFDAPTVTRFQNIKRIAHKVIEYIAKFENELKAIWEKPKFVRNCHYVLTLDRLKEHPKLIEKLIKSPGWTNQVKEWQHLNGEWFDADGNLIKKRWNEFDFSQVVDFQKKIVSNDKLNKEYKYLPIDTKFFPELKNELFSYFDNIDENLDGEIIKSDNWQALKSLSIKFKNRINLVYTDPPFNTSDTTEFMYKDKYQESTWLTFMSDRISLLNEFMHNDGSFYLHLDSNSNYYGRILLNNLFKGIYRNEIIWHFSDGTAPKGAFKRKINTIYFYSRTKENYFEEVRVPVLNPDRYDKTDKDGRAYFEDGHHGSNKRFYLDDGMIADNVWTYVTDKRFRQLNSQSSERFRNFKTQKAEYLIKRIIKASSSKNHLVMDIFNGSATTIATAHKMSRKWIGVELGEHFEGINIPRLKKVLIGDKSGISNDDDIDWKGGGFFRYYELEQYEDVLSKALYQWKSDKNGVEQYSFMQDQKLLDALELDYENKNIKVAFEKLYTDVDIAETLSNLSGKPIKELAEDYCVLVDKETGDQLKIEYNNMTFEKYPWIKPLIWWYSK